MKIPLNNDEYRKQTFLKCCVVTDGGVKFEHLGKKYNLTGLCFGPLEGKTVLVNSVFEVFRSDKKIGNATEA